MGTLAATALGFVVGSLIVRRQGIYFSMTTLALAQLMYFVYQQASFTGGEDDLQGIPRGRLFGVINLENDLSLYYVVLGIFVFGAWLIWRTIHSRSDRC